MNYNYKNCNNRNSEGNNKSFVFLFEIVIKKLNINILQICVSQFCMKIQNRKL